MVGTAVGQLRRISYDTAVIADFLHILYHSIHESGGLGASSGCLDLGFTPRVLRRCGPAVAVTCYSGNMDLWKRKIGSFARSCRLIPRS